MTYSQHLGHSGSGHDAANDQGHAQDVSYGTDACISPSSAWPCISHHNAPAIQKSPIKVGGPEGAKTTVRNTERM